MFLDDQYHFLFCCNPSFKITRMFSMCVSEVQGFFMEIETFLIFKHCIKLPMQCSFENVGS